MRIELSSSFFMNKDTLGDTSLDMELGDLFSNPVDEPVEVTLDDFDDPEYSGSDIELKEKAALLRAIKYAIKDMLDTNSSLYQDVYMPFSRHKQTFEGAIKVTFLSKLIKNILMRDRSYVTLDAYTYADNSQKYFSFSVPEHVLDEALSSSEKDMLLNVPHPGFSLLELGQFGMVNYVLGFYYEYLAKWCADPDDSNVRDLKRWLIGPH